MSNEVERQQTLLNAIQAIKYISEEKVFQLRTMNQRFSDMVNLKSIYR